MSLSVIALTRTMPLEVGLLGLRSCCMSWYVAATLDYYKYLETWFGGPGRIILFDDLRRGLTLCSLVIVAPRSMVIQPLGAPASLLGRTLLGAPGLTTRSKDTTRGSWHRFQLQDFDAAFLAFERLQQLVPCSS